jgi:hypothetical protein
MNYKILIITHGFYPEQTPRSFRATQLAQELIRQGHSVTVIAPEAEGRINFLENNGITFKSLGELKWQIFNFKKFGLIGKLYNKLINRLLPLFFEYPMMEIFFKVRKAIKSDLNRYDLLISVAMPYPIHWGVASAWKQDKGIARKWIADCGDPYCFHENDTFNPPYYFWLIEKWFMRKTDFISVPTEASKNGYFPEFRDKMIVIPQGFKFDDIKMPETLNDGILRFGYGGSFIKNRRDPSELLDFLTSISHDYKYEFHIYTNQTSFIQPFANRDSRIVLHKPINREDLLKEYAKMNFLVNFSNKGTTQTPSKLIDYIILDKPVLNIDTGNLKTEIVFQFLKKNFENSLKFSQIEQYRIENVAKKFLSLID